MKPHLIVQSCTFLTDNKTKMIIYFLFNFFSGHFISNIQNNDCEWFVHEGSCFEGFCL